MERTRFFRRPVFWVMMVALAAIAIAFYFTGRDSYTEVETSVAFERLEQGGIEEVVIEDREQVIKLDLAEPVTVDGQQTTEIQAQYPAGSQQQLADEVRAASGDGRITGTYDTEVTQDSIWSNILILLIPVALIVLLFLLFMSQMQGGGSRVLNFGKSKAKQITKDMPKTTFTDVAGADEAVQELHEIKDFLSAPSKYQSLGAKIPKGVLLFGPPGTGKTLLARAVAGEAGVPFYSISGSDFVEMFVGVGASRVRDLFEQAKQNAPAIVFVDEIDAVGRHRGAGMGGGHDEREQTLNQLLVEMDGFDTKGGVILIAATNRPDILDPALLRPGRFDRQIAVDAPDMEGRKAILRVHAKGKPFSPDVDIEAVARRTPGFSGADLANVINEAALLTARHNQRAITNDHLEEAIDRVIAGPERKTRAMSDHEKKITAYHESGHALVAWALPELAPVHKVTILPRGRSLGHTLVLPTEDKYTQTRAEMIDTLAYALGGRAAEELVFHEPTTGAGNDIEKATQLARSMVTQYGMSAKLGAVKYGSNTSEPFLGRNYGHERDYSDSIAAEIDAEVRTLIELAHDEAWEILVEYRDVLDNMVLELMEKETISHDDMSRICARVGKRKPIAVYNGFGKRKPSTAPPVLTPAERKAQAGDGGENGGRDHAGGGAADGGGDGQPERPRRPEQPEQPEQQPANTSADGADPALRSGGALRSSGATGAVGETRPDGGEPEGQG